jgi:hypothetical protein
MKRVTKLLLTLIMFCSSLPETAALAAEQKFPNIVYIMADDLGYNDLSCQGATKVLMRTPRRPCVRPPAMAC